MKHSIDSFKFNQTSMKAKNITIGTIIPSKADNLLFVKSILLDASTHQVELTLNNKHIMKVDLEDVVFVGGNVLDGTHDTQCH